MHPLRRERAKKRIAIYKLAKDTGVHAGTISAIERGERTPQAVTLAKLAEGLGVDVSTLEETPEPEPQRVRMVGHRSERQEFGGFTVELRPVLARFARGEIDEDETVREIEELVGAK